MKLILLKLIALVSVAAIGRAEVSSEVVPKAKKLQLLVLVPFTGEQPRVGVACVAASNIAAEAVNARSDILPDYRLELVFRDEGPYSNYAHQETIKFKRSFDSILQETQIYEAPIVVGPYYGPGCKALAPVIHELNGVMVAVGCSAINTNRKLYPNVYRIRMSAEVVAFPELLFMRQVGGWNRMAIIINADNWFDVALGVYLNNQAIENGFDVAFFDTLSDLSDQAMTSLKRSDSRIIVLEASAAAWNMKFFCQTYKFGMTGGKYAFFLFMGVYTEPSTFPAVVMPGCTRDMVFEQLKFTFWGTRLSETKLPLQPTSLGYNLKEFELKFNQLTNNTKPADYDKRAYCHDSILQSIVALDSAEKKLKSRLNLTLSDYKEHPRLVMKVVNESVATVQYTGLRLGFLKYSSRGELDDDTQAIAQWTPKEQLRLLFEVQRLPNGQLSNLSSYSGKLVDRPAWFAKDAKAPLDSSRVVVTLEEIPPEFGWFAISLASLASLKQVATFALSIFFPKKWPAVGTSAVTLGCLLLNAGAILFSVKMKSDTHCMLQRIFTSLGLTILLAVFLDKLAGVMQENARFVQPSSLTGGKGKTSKKRLVKVSPSSGGLYRALKTSLGEKLTISVIGVAIVLISVYLVAWMVTDPTKLRIDHDLDSAYDDDTDTFYSTDILKCESKKEIYWLIPLASVYGLLTAVSLLMCYQSRFLAVVDTSDIINFGPELSKVRLAMLNLANLFFGAALLMVVVPSPIYQQIILAIVLLAISIVTSVLLLLVPLIGSR